MKSNKSVKLDLQTKLFYKFLCAAELFYSLFPFVLPFLFVTTYSYTRAVRCVTTGGKQACVLAYRGDEFEIVKFGISSSPKNANRGVINLRLISRRLCTHLLVTMKKIIMLNFKLILCLGTVLIHSATVSSTSVIERIRTDPDLSEVSSCFLYFLCGANLDNVANRKHSQVNE